MYSVYKVCHWGEGVGKKFPKIVTVTSVRRKGLLGDTSKGDGKKWKIYSWVNDKKIWMAGLITDKIELQWKMT